MRDIMVDIETTGLRPDRNGVIQIAAVRFDVETGEVDGDFFDRCLKIPKWRSWDEGTKAWWGRQKPSILADILRRAEDPGTVMDDFAQWVGYMHETPPRFWAKPTIFDYQFVESYFSDFDVPSPFHFRNVMDCRSFAIGVALPGEAKSEADIPFEGDAHNALFDVLHQIKWMQAVVAR